MSVLPEIESRFDVLAKLGEGGMGCVYKVRHRDLGEVQIVKTLQAHLSSNEGLRERFVNEARRGMHLRHPHIAGVHDFAVCADGTGYIVMEYVHGLNLNELLQTKGPLSVPLVGAIALQTLDALDYLHCEHIVHRDISPDNLILMTTADGQPFVKLIDLGISKSLEAGQSMTATGQFLGKVHYASPEQFGGELDGRSDLYSLGIVLYKLLTNEDPIVGENWKEIISGHLFQPPRPFEVTAPGIPIPEAVKQAIFRALEKDPDKRYADAAEFAAAVQDAFNVHDARHTRPARTAAATTIVPAAADQTIAATTIVGIEAPRKPFPWKLVAPILALVVAVAVLFSLRERLFPPAVDYGKFYAVVIGESRYQKIGPLPTAVNDARSVKQLLEQRYGFIVTPLENATGQQILDALRATGKQMTPNDNLLIFYAGHGELLNDKGYWKGVDAELDRSNWISPALMKDALIDVPSKRTLIIADSCYSGALARGILKPAEDSEAKKSRLVLSSGGTAPVMDSADGEHSLFTRALLDTLAAPRANVTDIQTAFPHIRDRVIDSARRAGSEQIPQLAVMAEVGDEGGSFFFVKKRD
ncbi:MAG TPA: protein kinase [Thermoanaerobaculia bacterium]|nr:protein kinase [Thermoanaerobaculia bacterium]